MPNKERLRLLVAALRSGEYEQGNGYLKVRNKEDTKFLHCCLGVACELATANGVVLVTSEFFNEDNRKTVKFDGHSDFMPGLVSRWLEVDSSDLVVMSPDGYLLTGAAANDNHGLTFEQIATGIEANYKLLERDDDAPATD